MSHKESVMSMQLSNTTTKMIQHPQTSVMHLINKTKNKNYMITSIDAENT